MKNRIYPTEPTSGEMVFMFATTVLPVLVGILVGLFVQPRAVAILIGLVLIGTGLVSLGKLLALLNHPGKPPLEMSGRATILDREEKRWHDEYGEEWHGCWISLQFDTNEGPISMKARVNNSIFESVKPGDTISLRYNAANPYIAVLEGEYD